jgi:predicted DNA binding CopG/RHH family protein
MSKLSKEAFMPMDQYEKELLESIENNEWSSVEDLESQKSAAVAAARNTLKKNRRINLRLTEKDYTQIQIKAVEEGIPYQTLISSLVHKYLTGALAVR